MRRAVDDALFYQAGTNRALGADLHAQPVGHVTRAVRPSPTSAMARRSIFSTGVRRSKRTRKKFLSSRVETRAVAYFTTCKRIRRRRRVIPGLITPILQKVGVAQLGSVNFKAGVGINRLGRRFNRLAYGLDGISLWQRANVGEVEQSFGIQPGFNRQAGQGGKPHARLPKSCPMLSRRSSRPARWYCRNSVSA